MKTVIPNFQNGLKRGEKLKRETRKNTTLSCTLLLLLQRLPGAHFVPQCFLGGLEYYGECSFAAHWTIHREPSKNHTSSLVIHASSFNIATGCVVSHPPLVSIHSEVAPANGGAGKPDTASEQWGNEPPNTCCTGKQTSMNCQTDGFCKFLLRTHSQWLMKNQSAPIWHKKCCYQPGDLK